VEGGEYGQFCAKNGTGGETGAYLRVLSKGGGLKNSVFEGRKKINFISGIGELEKETSVGEREPKNTSAGYFEKCVILGGRRGLKVMNG